MANELVYQDDEIRIEIDHDSANDLFEDRYLVKAIQNMRALNAVDPINLLLWEEISPDVFRLTLKGKDDREWKQLVKTVDPNDVEFTFDVGSYFDAKEFEYRETIRDSLVELTLACHVSRFSAEYI